MEGSLAVKVSEESEISRQVDALQHLEVEAGIVTRELLTERRRRRRRPQRRTNLLVDIWQLQNRSWWVGHNGRGDVVSEGALRMIGQGFDYHIFVFMLLF